MVYLSGPLFAAPGDNTEINVRQALRVAEEVLAEGMVPFVPHLVWHWDALYRRAEADWLNHYCLPWLELSDCVLRFGGPSKTADQEIKLATTLGKPVFMSIPTIIVWQEAKI